MAACVNLVDELESSFNSCISLVTSQESSNITTDGEEVRASMEQCMQRFLDATRQLDAFFVQKRVLLAKHRPEPSSREDLSELRTELQRKEFLLQRHNEKLQQWQLLLSGANQGAGTASSTSGVQQQPVLQSSLLPSSGGVPGPPPPQASQMPGPSSQGMPMMGYTTGPLAYLEQTATNIGTPTRGGAS